MKIPSVTLLAGALVVLALLLLLSTPGTKSAPVVPTEIRHVTAVGEADLKVKPDQATVRFLVEQRSVSSATAEAAHRRQLDQLGGRLRIAGAEIDRIQIGNATLKELPQVLSGLSWVAESEVRVTVHDLAKVDGLLEAALSESGVRLQEVEYGLGTPEAQIQKGLDAALINARTRAETMASSASGKIGAPVEVEMVGAPVFVQESPETVHLRITVKARFAM